MAIDKVTLQILADHSRAASESMAFTLYRTAYSTFVKETLDFTTGLTTPEGYTFASSADLGAPWFVGLDYGTVIRHFDHYEEGDICLTNDPYSGYVCTHTPDIHLWKPIFYAGKPVCYSVGHIHNTDVGGAVPASLSRTLTEIHQEGIRMPPVKLFKAGKRNDELLEVMLANVRAPEQNWGDLKAIIAATNTGERKVLEMIEKFGINDFSQGMKDLLDYSELQTRNLISSIPDGEYFFCDYIDEDSAGGPPCRLAINMIVKEDSMVLDFTGSDPQLSSSMNMPSGGYERHTILLVGIYFAFYTLDPNILLNSGMTRPIRCILPEGTVVNPKFPAAVGMRSLTGTRLQDVIFGCLSQALPNRLPAAPSGSVSIMNLLTNHPRTGKRIMAAIDPVMGGGGGIPFMDGPNGSGANASFLKNTPVEINEVEVPIRINQYELTPDSGGAGRFRGGLSTTLEFTVSSPDTIVTARNRDRTRFRAWGVLQGKAGKPSGYWRNPDTPHEENLGNTDVIKAEPGDVIRIVSSGGGGWGDPLEREPQAVLDDVHRGFVSVDAAREEYGVVIREDRVDEEATRTLRAEMRAGGSQQSHFDFGPERDAFERTWNRATYDVLTQVLASIPVNWRFFVKHKIFEKVGDGRDGKPGNGQAVSKAVEEIWRRYPQIRDAQSS